MSHRLRIPAVTDRALKITVLVAGLIVVLGLLWFAGRTAQEGQRAEENGQQRDAAAGAAEQVIDCVQDPTTETTEDCEAEAQEAQETLEESVPAASLSKGQRAEVVLIASELLAARPVPSEDALVADVLARLPEVVNGEAGEQGPRGPAGADGESPTVEEVRALVAEVYDANPPRPGADGTDGASGSEGPQGPKGERGERGEQGEPGADGAQGPQGPQGDPGAPGSQGQTGPAIAFFTFTYLAVTYTCSDPDGDLSYECSVVE